MTTTGTPESHDSRPATFEHSLRVGGLIIQINTAVTAGWATAPAGEEQS